MKTFQINNKSVEVEVATSTLDQFPIIVRVGTDGNTFFAGFTHSMSMAYSVCPGSDDAEENAIKAISELAEQGVDIVTTGMRCETAGDMDPIDEPIDVAALVAQEGLILLDIEPEDISSAEL